MLIGNQYAENKIYRGIKHYDQMPLTSGDIHEYTDTAYMKNAYIMNNLLGYGTMNTPDTEVTAGGIRLSDPSVVMIDGDIALIQSDDDRPLVTIQSIIEAGYSEGTVCIVGWYQLITAGGTIRQYGGVDNSILPNDLLNETFNLQISSRYQFRWFPVIISPNILASNSLTLEIIDRDIHGEKLETKSELNSIKKVNNTFIAEKIDSMPYAESDIYIVPILEYTYDSSTQSITDSHPSSRLVTESTAPMAFMQYQEVYIVPETINTVQDIVIPMNISEYQDGDILQVIYEGLVLMIDENYTVNAQNNTITLLDFTVNQGDHIQFTVTKIVEASNITDISTTFIHHMDNTGSEILEGHVKLSDTLSTSDATGGVAATPNMVNKIKESVNQEINAMEEAISIISTAVETISDRDLEILDDTTSVRYKLGIDNGLLYIEEV